ncbi:hypothetical protein PHAVU_002G149100 [Phaseolus vulgaris]
MCHTRKLVRMTTGSGFIMDHGKGIASESSAVVREHKKWTTDMDFRLLNAMIDEASMGNRIDGSWTTQGYTNIVKSLHQTGLVGITKNNVKNRQKSLKDKWREIHDLFSGLSGFAWNPSTKIFEAEDEALQVDGRLWGLDRATGHGGRTTLQSSNRTQSHHFNVDLNDHNMEDILEEPGLDATQCETPRSADPNVDSYSPDPNLTPPLVPPQSSQPSGGTSSSRGSKRKAPMVDVIDLQLERLNTRFEGLTDILGRGTDQSDRLCHIAERQAISSKVVALSSQRVANATEENLQYNRRHVVAEEERNSIFREHTRTLPRTSTFQYSEYDIWEMLVEMNIQDGDLLDNCYDFLCGHPNAVKQLFGLPLERRMRKLVKIMTTNP